MNAPSNFEVAAANKLGIPVAEYIRLRADGWKWCTGGRHWRPQTEFRRDRTRADGLACRCKACHNADTRAQRRKRRVARERAEGVPVVAHSGVQFPTWANRHGGGQ